MKNQLKNSTAVTKAVVAVVNNAILVKSGKSYKVANEKQTKVITEKGYYYIPANLLGKSTKIEKSDNSKNGYLTKILYLSPSKISGYNTCSMATVGCASACLNMNGHGRFDSNQIARINKTKYFMLNREKFMKQLVKELTIFVAECTFEDKLPAVRINGTSDINLILFKYKGKTVLELFPQIKFYDYTKVLNRFDKEIPSNYFLTASRDETNEKQCLELLSKGFNSAFVFKLKKDQSLPKTYKGFKVINGEETDLRFLDDNGVIVGLRAKGKAQTDETGFTIDLRP